MRITATAGLALVGALLGVAFVLDALAGGVATVRVVPASTSVNYDDGPFTVRVELSGLDHHGRVGYDDDRDTTPDRFEPSDGLGAFELTFTFNSAAIEVIDVEAGQFLENAGSNAECLEREPREGQYSVGCVTFGSRAGPQGSGRLAEVTFRPLANGTTNLSLDAQLSGPLADPVAATVLGGVVRVAGAPRDAPSPTPTSSSPNATPGPGGPSSGPGVIGGGTPGAGNPGDPNDPTGGPAAGTGYDAPDATVRPLIAGASLAVAGFVLLVAGSRLALRRRS